MKKQLPIGLSDYKEIIDKDYYYVDKTLFIDDILKYSVAALLLPRPRRFGKTLNMSMLRYFFEKTEQSNAYLFEGKKIWQMPERAALQGKFPVIFLTFKDIKEDTWHITKNKLIAVIAEEYKRHKYLLESNVLDENDKTIFNNICAKVASDEEYHNSLKNLSAFLFRFYQVKPFVLLDEYDAPIHAGFLHNYYEEVLQFVRGIMTGVFKDNSYLERGVITGILHTVKEGIFSGLNNLKVITILNKQMCDKFGFTEQEIEQLLQDYDFSNIGQDFKDWYNGYLIGTVKIYNPWSALSCIDNDGEVVSYWINTSDNKLIYKIITQADTDFKDACADLIMGKIINNIKIVTQITLPDMIKQPDSIWGLLLFSGYVTPNANHIIKGIKYTDLKLPNEELRVLFKMLVKEFFDQSVSPIKITALYEALKNTDGAAFSKIVSTFVMQSMSYYDISADEPEKSYHLFVLGLLVVLAEKYQVLSNRESGEGRFDIMLIPIDKNLPGIIIEFKKLDDTETMAECADRAIEQIKERNYAAQLEQQGVKKIVAFGIALHKKEVLLKQEELSN